MRPQACLLRQAERRVADALTTLHVEDIHWGKRRDDLSALGVDDFNQAWARMHFFEAASGLAHLYMGFAVLVRSALGSTFPD